MNVPLNDSAVLFVDIINDFNFSGGKELEANTKQILPNLIKLRNFAKEKKLPIIYVNDHYGLWKQTFGKSPIIAITIEVKISLKS